MKKYLLDTNICVFFLRGRFDVSNHISHAIHTYAKEKVRLRKKGTPIEDLDLLIGATAKAHGLVLVTENFRHLERIEGLELENWIQR